MVSYDQAPNGSVDINTSFKSARAPLSDAPPLPKDVSVIFKAPVKDKLDIDNTSYDIDTICKPRGVAGKPNNGGFSLPREMAWPTDKYKALLLRMVTGVGSE